MESLEKEKPVDVIKRCRMYPYSAVGLVRATLKKGQYRGTGCLIGPNIVLTCAHNCFNVPAKKYFSNMEFIPAPIIQSVKGASLIEKGFKVKEVLIPEEY